MKTDLDIIVHTDELHDIVSAPPIWLVRWGISLFLLLLLLFVALSAIITYPDFIEVPLTINSLNKSGAISSSFSGRIMELPVSDNSMVEKGQVLAYIQLSLTEGHSARFLDSNKEAIIAPRAGRLNYIGLLKRNLLVTENQDIFFISRTDDQFFGELHVPQNEVGKIRAGQDVLIKIINSPYEENGLLRGKIKYINRIPYSDSVFLAEVTISNYHETAGHSDVILRAGMTAKAEVVTQNTSLLQRIISSVNKW